MGNYGGRTQLLLFLYLLLFCFLLKDLPAEPLQQDRSHQSQGRMVPQGFAHPGVQDPVLCTAEPPVFMLEGGTRAQRRWRRVLPRSWRCGLPDLHSRSPWEGAARVGVRLCRQRSLPSCGPGGRGPAVRTPAAHVCSAGADGATSAPCMFPDPEHVVKLHCVFHFVSLEK